MVRVWGREKGEPMEPLNNQEPEDFLSEEDRRTEAIHDGMTVMAERMADMLGIEGIDERSKMVDGFRSIFESPKMSFKPLPPQSFVLPSLPPSTPSCHTSTTPGGQLVTYDWYCLLSRTYRQTFSPQTNTCILDLYHGQSIRLDASQTKSLFKYINSIPASGFAQQYRRPDDLLAHPAVKKIIEAE